MKQVAFSVVLLSLVLFSCTKYISKPAAPTTLEGNWRMIAVKDNSSGSIITKPSLIQGDVDITFAAADDVSGKISGHTPTNQIWQSDYFTGANRLLRIPALAMTKLAETSWGGEFVINIRSSEHYGFASDGKLIITTTEKTLTFQRQ